MPVLTRRHLLLRAGALLMTTPVGRSAAATPDLAPIAPDEAGFAPDLEARLDRLIAQKRAWGLHGVVLVRGGRLVLERYFEGEDHVRGVGTVGLLYGIALAQGKVPPPEAPLLAAFPEYADLAQGGRERLTIHHVLTMTMGTDWDESSLFYTDPRNRETAMDNAPDRYRYVLERSV